MKLRFPIEQKLKVIPQNICFTLYAENFTDDDKRIERHVRLREFDASVGDMPSDMHLAKALLFVGQHEDAWDFFTRVARHGTANNDREDARLGYIGQRDLKTQRYKSIHHYNACHELNPDRVDALFIVAVEEERQGHGSLALMILKHIVENGNDSYMVPPTCMLLAKLAYRKGEFKLSHWAVCEALKHGQPRQAVDFLAGIELCLGDYEHCSSRAIFKCNPHGASATDKYVDAISNDDIIIDSIDGFKLFRKCIFINTFAYSLATKKFGIDYDVILTENIDGLVFDCPFLCHVYIEGNSNNLGHKVQDKEVKYFTTMEQLSQMLK